MDFIFFCLPKPKKLLTNVNTSCQWVGAQEIEDTSSTLRNRPSSPPPKSVLLTTAYFFNLVRECINKRGEAKCLGKINGHKAYAKELFGLAMGHLPKEPWAPLLISPKYCFVVLQDPCQNQQWFQCNNQHNDIAECK